MLSRPLDTVFRASELIRQAGVVLRRDLDPGARLSLALARLMAATDAFEEAVSRGAVGGFEEEGPPGDAAA